MSIKNYNSPVAENIVEILNEKGIKQKVFAKKIGISEKVLSDMLNGRRVIKVCEIEKIAIALEVDGNTLLGIRQEVGVSSEALYDKI
jgi:Plasmid maintenance system antidote protein